MADHVFILGAGASRESGAPLMSTFVDDAEDVFRTSSMTVSHHYQAFQTVLDTIEALQPLYAKTNVDLNNIEALFGVIEMASIVGRLGDMELGESADERIQDVRSALTRLVVTTLETRIHYPLAGAAPARPSPTPSYAALVALIGDIRASNESVAIITFNYDIALDYALFAADTPTDYCLERRTETSLAVRLLKLHGSTNWGSCSDTQCRAILPYSLQEFFDRKRLFYDHLPDPAYALIQCGEHLAADLVHCGRSVDPLPVLVPPTWNKSGYHGDLTWAWRYAAHELRFAKSVYVLGYSLPETDLFFRYLFALGTVGHSRIRRFWVFDPDPTVAARFRDLVGRGIAERFHHEPLHFFNEGNGALAYLREKLVLR